MRSKRFFRRVWALITHWTFFPMKVLVMDNLDWRKYHVRTATTKEVWEYVADMPDRELR